jgi:Glyceraldehyde 3-phosphate dehydrogenase, C-terminal domain
MSIDGTRLAPRPRFEPIADPDEHRLGDGDRVDLPGAAREVDGHRSTRAAPQRVPDRLRIRSAAADDGRRGECGVQARRGRAGILGYEERPLVSVDYKDDPRSAIVDAPSTMVVDGTCVKVLAWYDNEIGYVRRMIELAQKVGAAL